LTVLHFDGFYILAITDVLVENFVPIENSKRDKKFTSKHLKQRKKDGDCEPWKIFQRGCFIYIGYVYQI
jgi:hypothetical protein